MRKKFGPATKVSRTLRTWPLRLPRTTVTKAIPCKRIRRRSLRSELFLEMTKSRRSLGLNSYRRGGNQSRPYASVSPCAAAVDTPRHFWVSAALTVLTDESRATFIGLEKELADANPGGSGFSFADLAADRAGILFALAATRDAESAQATQMLIVQDGPQADDYCPEIKDLPEGITRDQFQTAYGGVGGKITQMLRHEIDRRMSTKAVLRFSK